MNHPNYVTVNGSRTSHEGLWLPEGRATIRAEVQMRVPTAQPIESEESRYGLDELLEPGDLAAMREEAKRLPPTDDPVGEVERLIAEALRPDQR